MANGYEGENQYGSQHRLPFSTLLVDEFLDDCLRKALCLTKLKPVFLKHYTPNICLLLKMAKFAKCHNSTIFFFNFA